MTAAEQILLSQLHMNVSVNSLTAVEGASFRSQLQLNMLLNFLTAARYCSSSLNTVPNY